jgi:phosphatidate cytidylyltransferase
MIEKNLLKRVITSLILVFILFSMFVSSMMMVITIIIISSITFYEFNRLIFNIYKKIFLSFLISGTVLLYLFIFVFIVFFIESVQMVNPEYKLFFFYSIIVSIASDIGGFAFGKLLKGKKLTKISPNKTISGSIGSFILSLITIPFFVVDFNFININLFVLITLIISLTSQLGDLLISYLKRQANVKDTGNILPGHGGILDRIDGILFAAPMGLFLLNFVSYI